VLEPPTDGGPLSQGEEKASIAGHSHQQGPRLLAVVRRGQLVDLAAPVPLTAARARRDDHQLATHGSVELLSRATESAQVRVDVAWVVAASARLAGHSTVSRAGSIRPSLDHLPIVRRVAPMTRSSRSSDGRPEGCRNPDAGDAEGGGGTMSHAGQLLAVSFPVRTSSTYIVG